jgi:GDP-L-fucose synthase
MKKRILILGGYGFMGTNLNIAFRHDEKYDIINESRRTECNVLNLSQLKLKIKDINPDIIIFAAANIGSISYVMTYSADIMSDNSQMYLNLYKAVSEVNPNILIINPLSNCSYPSISNVQNEDVWWNGALHPSIESYGFPKKFGFTLSECYRKQYGIKTLNLILPNSYGENDHLDPSRTHAMSGIIMRMIQSMRKKDKEFVVWGTGSPIREWIYMPDVAKIFKYVVDNEYYSLPNPINLGQEIGISIKDSVLLIKKILNYDVEIIYDTTKPDGDPVKILGSKLFNKHFPNFTFTPYETGIYNAIEYYKNYEDIK